MLSVERIRGSNPLKAFKTRSEISTMIFREFMERCTVLLNSDRPSLIGQWFDFIFNER